MLLTHPDLVQLVDAGVITGLASPSQINAASIDVRLADGILVERPHGKFIDLAAKHAPDFDPAPLEDGRVYLYPGTFVLASTIETFHLPNDIACEFKLKSSAARSGLDHALAGWGDPGWHGSRLTLELHNTLQWQTLILTPGMPIGQIVFWRGAAVPDEASYATRGQYNNDLQTQQSRGIR